MFLLVLDYLCRLAGGLHKQLQSRLLPLGRLPDCVRSVCRPGRPPGS